MCEQNHHYSLKSPFQSFQVLIGLLFQSVPKALALICFSLSCGALTMICALLVAISLTRIFILVKVTRKICVVLTKNIFPQPIMFHNLNHELIFPLESVCLGIASFSYSSAWAFYYQRIDMGELPQKRFFTQSSDLWTIPFL